MKKLTLFLAICIFSLAKNTQAQTSLEKNVPYIVSLDAAMLTHLSTLNIDEKPEQCRDWLKYALINSIPFSEDQKFELLYDFSPLRKDYLEPMSNYEYGESRSVVLSSGEIYLLIPNKTLSQKNLISKAADDYRLLKGNIPKNINLVVYEFDLANKKMSFSYQENILGDRIYSAEYGYTLKTISDKVSLQSFLSEVDDIVYIKTLLNGIEVGGRKYENQSNQSKVTIEDLAVLYQANNNAKEDYLNQVGKSKLREYYFEERELISSQLNGLSIEEYLLKVNDDLKKIQEIKQNSFLLSSVSDELKNKLNEREKSAKEDKKLLDKLLTYEAYFADFKNTLKVDEINIGFSLDPKLKDKQLAKSIGELVNNPLFKRYKEVLQKIITNLGKDAENELVFFHLFLRYLRGEYVPDLKQDKFVLEGEQLLQKIARQDVITILKDAKYLPKDFNGNIIVLTDTLKSFQTKHELYQKKGKLDVETYESLLRMEGLKNYFKDSVYSVRDSLYSTLFILKNKFSYQIARYDGKLQGTEVGMTLFYTDLMMKLWGFNYLNSAPEKDVIGFKSKTNYPISKVYLDEITEKNSTRYWLGVLNEGYNFRNDNELLFSHISTRIYNASQNELYPGREGEADITSRRYTDWWNNHYSQVADYEPEFYRLNQIMKWTTIIQWLKKKNSFSWLNNELVKNRNLDFETWYKTNANNLKTNVNIPFLDKKVYLQSTECLSVLESKSFDLFGDFLSAYKLYGGVSLFDSRTFEFKRVRNFNRKISGFERKNVTKNTGFEMNFGEFKKLTLKPLTKTIEIANNVVNNSIDFFASRQNIASLTKNVKRNSIELVNAQQKNMGKLLFNKDLFNKKTINLNIETDDFTIIKEALENTGDITKESFLDIFRTKKRSINENIEDVFEINKIKYIKSKKLDYWLELKNVSKFDKTVKYDLRFMGKTKNDYLVVNYKAIPEVENIKLTFPFRKIEYFDSSIKLSSALDIQNNKKVIINFGENSTELYLSKNEILFKNNISNSLRNKLMENSQLRTTLKNIYADNEINHAVFASNGESFIISKTTPNEAILSKLKAMNIENGIVISKNQEGIYIKTDALLESLEITIPSVDRITLDESRMLNDFINKGNKNDKWYDALAQAPEGRITIEDYKAIEKINIENHQMVESYYDFDGRNNLPPNNALADIRSSGNNYQILLKENNKKPKVLSIENKSNIHWNDVLFEFEDLYEGSRKYSKAEVEGIFSQIKELLTTITQNTSAKKIITKEPKFVNCEVINKFFKISEEHTFCLDQPSIARSIKNLQVQSFPDKKKAIFLSTQKISESQRNSVKELGITVKEDVDFNEFEKIIEDSTYTQIFLHLERGKDKDWYKISLLAEQFDDTNAKKDFIHILSDDAIFYERVFSESNLSNLVFTNDYDKKSTDGFNYSFEEMIGFMKNLYNQQVIITEKIWSRAIKKNKEIEELVKDKFIKIENNVSVEISKFTKSQLREVNDFLNKLNIPFREKDIQELFNDNQKIQVEKLNNGENIQQTLKGIIKLKCFLINKKKLYEQATIWG